MPRDWLKSEDEVTTSYYNGPQDYARQKQLYIEWYSFAARSSVKFEAWLTKFSDKYESDWASQQVYGRNDPIQTFKGTKRTIQISWKLIADHLQQAIDNQGKVSLLMAYLYPVYDTSGFLMAPPLMRLRFANWAVSADSFPTTKAPSPFDPNLVQPAKDSGLVGRCDGFSFEPVIENGVFDDMAGSLYPKELELSTTFHVFHTHRLGWQIGGDGVQARDQGFQSFPYGESLTRAVADGTRIAYASATPLPANSWNLAEQTAYQELMKDGLYSPSEARRHVQEMYNKRLDGEGNDGFFATAKKLMRGTS